MEPYVNSDSTRIREPMCEGVSKKDFLPLSLSLNTMILCVELRKNMTLVTFYFYIIADIYNHLSPRSRLRKTSISFKTVKTATESTHYIYMFNLVLFTRMGRYMYGKRVQGPSMSWMGRARIGRHSWVGSRNYWTGNH